MSESSRFSGIFSSGDAYNPCQFYSNGICQRRALFQDSVGGNLVDATYLPTGATNDNAQLDRTGGRRGGDRNQDGCRYPNNPTGQRSCSGYPRFFRP